MSYNEDGSDNVSIAQSIENNSINNSLIDDAQESASNNTSSIRLEDDIVSNDNNSNNQSSISNTHSITTFVNETDTILSDVSEEDNVFNENNVQFTTTDPIPEPNNSDNHSQQTTNTNDEVISQPISYSRIDQNQNNNWFLSKEYVIFKNQLRSARKNNTFILKECKECKRLLDLKYEDINSIVNNIQTSVIFMSTISGFLQATKTQTSIDLDIIAICSITISTYISLIISISKFYKLDELKDRIQSLREKYSLLHNRIEYRMDVLGPWNNKYLWVHQNPKNKLEEWREVMQTMKVDYNEIIKTKQTLTTDFEVIMDTISRNKYNNMNSRLNYADREQLFFLRQKESALEQRIVESSKKFPSKKRPTILLQHEELDNWDEDDSIV
jgi:hypothetical protein